LNDWIVLGDEFTDLLGRAKAGDEQAFTRLFRSFQPAVLRYLRVVAPDAAEDLAADSWLDVVRGLVRFSGDEDGFRAWVLTIVRHRHVDRLRRERRQPLVVLAGGELPEPDHARAAIDGGADERFSTEAALRLIATLPSAQAEAIVLRSVVGLSVAEVAGLTDRRPGAVRVLVHRGLRSLAEQLSRPETDEAVTP
jgi:RNA polymerase sigma-70 factor (ECF subfamily)